MIETATSGGLVPFCAPDLCATAGCDAVICRGAALTNAEIVERSRRVIPGGVNSPIRSFRSVGGTPYVVAKGSGARVTDVEGTEYLDLVQSYGAVIHGHAHPRITAAITAAAADGTSFGAPTPREMKIAEEITSRVPGMQMVRLVNSGTEATMAVIRLARGHTSRDKVLKFSGNYHGHGDALLTESGSAFAVFGLPDSAGVTGKSVSETLVAPFNVVPTIDEQTACIVVEPVAANMGLVAPRPGFLEGLRAECDRVGALLIFDEVITGFRLARGGAAQYYGVTPDLWCFGKVIGGGLPVGAFGGRADVMASLAPLGPVFQAGTLSGNPLATAAGLAALSMLSNESYEQLYATAERLGAGLQSAFDRAGISAVVPVVGSLVGLHIATEPAYDYVTAKNTDVDRYRRFFHAMLRRGVAMAPGAYEVMFPGLAHTDDVIDAIIDRAHEAAAEIV
jgi:glutamate-1-semialdehyde 2,1-aminomutase